FRIFLFGFWICFGFRNSSFEFRKPGNDSLCETAHYASLSQVLASSTLSASKYRILAIVNGLQTFAIHFSQAFSPTRAMRLIFVQCVVENLMSSHSACMSQPWKSWNAASTFILPDLAISASTSGTNFL